MLGFRTLHLGFEFKNNSGDESILSSRTLETWQQHQPWCSFHNSSGVPQAAQAHYVWVRASEVIWSEYTRIISVLSDAK